MELTPWSYLPSFNLLSGEAQRRYNQLYALGTNEVFAVFETEFITTILQRWTKKIQDNPILLKSMADFCSEETKHAEMFHLLNLAACPEYYGQEKYFFSKKADKMGFWLLQVIKTFPQVFGVWVWIALFFEERSLIYGKHYLMTSNSYLNERFREVHKLHMIEEAHHVKLDEVFVHYFYKPLSLWKRQLSAFMLERIVRSYIAPKRLSLVLAKVLEREFPEEKEVLKKCLSELPLLSQNKTFLNLSLGFKATERTRRQLGLFPEFKKVLEILPD